MKNKTLLYSKKDLSIIEKHIKKYFGHYDIVYHEIYSPDIHLDIIRIDSTPKHNYYTFITLGAGAYKMNIPNGLQIPSRAEYLITLPSDWDIDNLNSNQELYWPIGFLKTAARIPISCDSFLAYGHILSADEKNSPLATNTKLCSMVLSYPKQFDQACLLANLKNKEQVIFYKMNMLYEDELLFKQKNEISMEEFEKYLGDIILKPLDINRPSCIKNN